MGWIRPVDLIDMAKSASEDSSNERRGWWGLGWIWAMGRSVGAVGDWKDPGMGRCWAAVAGLAGISASTGMSEIEIRLLSPRPRRGLFFCCVDMGLLSRARGSFIVAQCSTWNS